MITQKKLHELVDYNRYTGVFRRIDNGKLLGTYDNGYYKFQLCGYRLGSHVWAWYYVHGKLPDGDIDHINNDPADNSLINLRDVSRKTNIQNMNRKPRKGKKSGLPTGVTDNVTSYRAHLLINGKNTALGSFKTVQEAEQAYLDAKRKYHSGFLE